MALSTVWAQTSGQSLQSNDGGNCLHKLDYSRLHWGRLMFYSSNFLTWR